MAQVTVAGVVLWAKHIHGDGLAERVTALPGGHVVRLTVDGVAGDWRKMDDGCDGRPTPGLRPLGDIKAVWRDLYMRRRGATVALEAAEHATPLLYPALAPTQDARMAALQRMLSVRGGSSEGWKFSRQDIYDERDDELQARRLAKR